MNLTLFLSLLYVGFATNEIKAGFLKNELTTIEIKFAFLFQKYVIPPPLNNIRFSRLFTEYGKSVQASSFLIMT